MGLTTQGTDAVKQRVAEHKTIDASAKLVGEAMVNMRKFRLKCLYKLTYFWKKDFSSTGGTAENFSSSFSSGNTGPSII